MSKLARWLPFKFRRKEKPEKSSDTAVVHPQQLMRSFSRIPAQTQIFMNPGSRWTQKDLMNLYQESRDVLLALGVTDEHEQRNRATA